MIFKPCEGEISRLPVGSAGLNVFFSAIAIISASVDVMIKKERPWPRGTRGFPLHYKGAEGCWSGKGSER